MPFAIPVLRWEPKNHADDCQFCCVIVTGFSAKNKHKTVYTNENNSHDDSLPVPEPPQNGLAFLEQM